VFAERSAKQKGRPAGENRDQRVVSESFFQLVLHHRKKNLAKKNGRKERRREDWTILSHSLSTRFFTRRGECLKRREHDARKKYSR